MDDGLDAVKNPNSDRHQAATHGALPPPFFFPSQPESKSLTDGTALEIDDILNSV
jgi:hypothetical protein